MSCLRPDSVVIYYIKSFVCVYIFFYLLLFVYFYPVISPLYITGLVGIRLLLLLLLLTTTTLYYTHIYIHVHIYSMHVHVSLILFSHLVAWLLVMLRPSLSLAHSFVFLHSTLSFVSFLVSSAAILQALLYYKYFALLPLIYCTTALSQTMYTCII